MEQKAAVPITAEDLFRFQSLQGAALSPDGQALVYAVSHIENHQAPAEAGRVKTGSRGAGRKFLAVPV
jgi:hypothetical protein